MKELDIFLEALSRVMKNKRGHYVPHLFIQPSKFGAIKTYKIDVWIVDGDDKQLISSVSSTENVATDKAKLDIVSKLTVDTIENILKWYGL